MCTWYTNRGCFLWIWNLKVYDAKLKEPIAPALLLARGSGPQYPAKFAAPSVPLQQGPLVESALLRQGSLAESPLGLDPRVNQVLMMFRSDMSEEIDMPRAVTYREHRR